MARSRFPLWVMALLLALVTMALYWPATSHDFVNFDDNLYVTENAQVQSGLTWENLNWALFKPEVCFGYWHPLTLLSHMADCQLYGLKPWGHHLTNALLHAVNTVLVFLLLRGLTGALWRSLLVAALFGWHPLHVESVAWVAERKDVLSSFFGLLALIAYARYAKERSLKSKVQSLESAVSSEELGYGLTRHESPFTLHASRFYLLSLFCFAFSLTSKPMLVTLPFVLLLLDYWPLRRFELSALNSPLSTMWRLVREKIPFMAVAAVVSIVTFVMVKHASAVLVVKHPPFGASCGNALISYCRYLAKMFWPRDLAIFYPPPGYWPMEQVLLAGGVILGISVLLFVQRRRFPFLLMGWLWYCGTLVPAIGLVQAGQYAMADRNTYIPSLGVLVLAIWGAYDLTRGWRCQVPALSLAGGLAAVLSLALTRQQLGCWKDSETLFRHALEVTENNYLARNNLGAALLEKGRVDEAIRQCQEAIRLGPDGANAHNDLGAAFLAKGQTDEAIRQFQEAIRLGPDAASAHYNLGRALTIKGQVDAAISQYQEALRLKPDLAEAHNNLGNALLGKGQADEAIRQCQEALRLKPDYAPAHYNLGAALDRKGQTDEAISHYQEALRLKPDNADACFNLANALLMKGRTDEAIRQLQEVLRLKPDYAEAHNNLGVALGRKGQTDEAIRQYQQALRLKPDYAEAHNNLGNAIGRKGQPDEAIRHFQEALRLKPDYAEAHSGLGAALAQKGRLDEAIGQYQEALRLKPDDADIRRSLGYLRTNYTEALGNLAGALEGQGKFAEAIQIYQAALRARPDQGGVLNNLAWLLATCPDAAFRNGPEAVRLATRACELTGYTQPLLIGTLAAAQAEAGDFRAAIATGERAAALATELRLEEVAAKNRELLQLYRQGQPFHEKKGGG